jgi:DNA-binding SARP family transcriptional activator
MSLAATAPQIGTFEADNVVAFPSARSGTVSDGLEIRLLGPFEARLGGRPATVNGSKRRAVLAVLALSAGRVVSVDTLVDVLWRTDEPAAPRNAVQHHVTRLRAELGADAITAFPNGYALTGARVDALVFEDLVAAARAELRAGDPEAAAESAARALALHRGSALQGLPDTAWVCAEAARLDAVRVDALEEQFEAALALGRHGEIVSAIRAAVDESPFRERLHGQLMLALYRCGRQADALEAFRHARLVLSEELGLEPGPELRRLERAILAHDPSLALPLERASGEDEPATERSPAHRRDALADVLQLMRAHVRHVEELYAQAVAAAAATPSYS